MLPHQTAFLELALQHEVLKFGQFTLKSGRVSPYFFNLGKISSGAAMGRLAGAYAQALQLAGVEFDMLFGPAYKGIPLATAVAVALAKLNCTRPATRSSSATPTPLCGMCSAAKPPRDFSSSPFRCDEDPMPPEE